MKIVADKNIPFLKGVVEKYGEVTYLDGSEFSNKTIRDADTLIVRTVTHFDKNILENTNVRLICSATIGYDHIDTDYCQQNNIVWKNAPGCNSGSVQQYVLSSLLAISGLKNFDLKEKTIGIVGVGNVGRKVSKVCELMGMRVLLNDPPRQQYDTEHTFVDLDTIKRQADIITFHTPLTKTGNFATYHLADDAFFNSLEKTPIIINTSRGGIIHTNSIKRALSNKLISGAIIDCWENEPHIDLDYMSMVDIATPHIAGYSADGKANATKMALNELANYWDLPKDPIDTISIPDVDNNLIDYSVMRSEGRLKDIILTTYNPLDDYKKLLNAPDTFSQLRSTYPLRREFFAYTIQNVTDSNDLILLESLGFNTFQ